MVESRTKDILTSDPPHTVPGQTDTGLGYCGASQGKEGGLKGGEREGGGRERERERECVNF